MTGRRTTGADAICAALEELGVRVVFGVAGTQNVQLFDGIRRSSLRLVTATHELAAAFMANGYARVSGSVAVLVTIPGPGFAYALPALAEARLDSVPLLHLAGAPATEPGAAFQLQAIDQEALAAPVAKAVLHAERGEELGPLVGEAYRRASSGEPGPVVLHVPPRLFAGRAPIRSPGVAADPPAAPDPADVARIAESLSAAERVVVYAGQGAAFSSAEVGDLAAALRAPIVTTTSGRGVVPEDHELAIPLDHPGAGSRIVNELVERADLVLALGCKLSHNGTGGFMLRLPAEKLVHVDASSDVLGANYPASIAVRADVGMLLRELSHRAEWRLPRPGFEPAELAAWRSRAAAQVAGPDELSFPGLGDETAAGFVRALRGAMPRDAVLVTDSGLHQHLARRHFTVTLPRSLVVPSDFQSMGFGVPAGIGAALAEPRRQVVVLVGDGGLAMSGLELATAGREQVGITVIALTDGYLGLIRLEQLAAVGHAHGITVAPIDLAALANAVGARYHLLEGHLEAALADALVAGLVTLAEARPADSRGVGRLRTRGRAQSAARVVLGPGATARLKRRLRGS